MNARILFSALLVLSLVGTACDGEEPAPTPGSLLVNWTLGTVFSCDSLGLTKIEARAYTASTTVEADGTTSASCEGDTKSGSLIIAELVPAGYTVVVEGFDGDGVGIWMGEAPTRASVPDGAEGTSDLVQLQQKKALLVVDWLLAEGKCNKAGVEDVEVQLLAPDGPIETKAANCDNVFSHPMSGEEDYGLFFEDIPPRNDGIILAYGMDADGNKIRRGQIDNVVLEPGGDHREVVNMVACDSTMDPVCIAP